MKRIVILVIASLLPFFAFSQEQRWFKGNLHTHTTNSDGDSPPRQVVRWYQDHEYNFLVITDHDTLTDPRYLDTDKSDDFVLIPGEEVTDRAEGKPVHLNAIGISHQVKPQRKETKLATMQSDVDAIRSADGIAQINHPNWHYSFNDSVLSRMKNASLVEIYNVSDGCNNFAAGGSPGMEEIWDRVLSSGTLVYGTITDDTHDYTGEFSAKKNNPGRGWVMVRAKELTPKAIVTSLQTGSFYATVGVALRDVRITDNDYTVEIEPDGDGKYTTFFIGENGKVLKEEFGVKATYRFAGNEGYVRAKVVCSSGEFAITQPVIIGRGND